MLTARPPRLALLAYATGWVLAAAVVVALLLTVLDSGEPDVVALPPVRETELDHAAREANCELRRARPGDTMNPPVAGAVGALPARPGFYEDAPSPSSLIAAMRDGLVVIQFRGLDAAGVDLLETVQEAQPDGTIVAPNETRMPYVVAVSSYRRLLGCRDLGAASVDAIQLFRGRFVGTGPDG